MAFIDFLNKTCKIQRKSKGTSVGEFGEAVVAQEEVADDIPCRLEKLYDRELVEAYGGGDHDKGIYVLYLKSGQDINSGDVVTINETVQDFDGNNSDANDVIIMDVEDAGGGQSHHLQCFCRYREEL